MVSVCCVAKCSERSCGHVFPKDVRLRKEWLHAIRRDHFKPSKHSRVCSKHFKIEDYREQSWASKEAGIKHRKWLKPDAVPSVFQWSSGEPNVMCSRQLRKQQADAVCRRLVAGARPDRNLPVSAVSRSSAGEDSKDQRQARRHRTRQRAGSESLAHQPPSDTEPECSTSGATGVVFDRRRGRGSGPKCDQVPAAPEQADTHHDDQGEAATDHFYRRRHSGGSEEGGGCEPDAGWPPSPPSGREGASGAGRATLSVRRPSTADGLMEAPLSTPDPPLTEPLPLKIDTGALAKHLAAVRSRHRQLDQLQGTFNSLLRKTQFRAAHPDWDGVVPSADRDAPLVTLRGDQLERFPRLEPVSALSADLLQPLTPAAAWRTVAALRLRLLDLQLRLMHTRILVLGGDLRGQECDAMHRRYRMNMKKQLRESRLIQSLSTNSTSLCKRLEDVFTPMQLTVFRTGGKPRWGKEDIRRAIQLMLRLSREDYEFVRKRLRIPMPSPKIIPQGVKRFKSLKPLYDEMVAKHAESVRHDAEKENGIPAVRKRKLGGYLEEPRSEFSAAERPTTKRKRCSVKLPAARPKPRPSRSPQPTTSPRSSPASGAQQPSLPAQASKPPRQRQQRPRPSPPSRPAPVPRRPPVRGAGTVVVRRSAPAGSARVPPDPRATSEGHSRTLVLGGGRPPRLSWAPPRRPPAGSMERTLAAKTADPAGRPPRAGSIT